MLKLPKGTGNPEARIMFISDTPSFDDVKKQEHFVDGAGREFRKMCFEAGIDFHNTFSTSVGRSVQLGKSATYFTEKKKESVGKTLFRGKWISPDVLADIPQLEQEIANVKPNIIVPLGPLALFLATGEISINTWRGSVNWSEAFKTKVIATYHPSMILKVWAWRYHSVRDLQRIAYESTFPELKTPSYNFTIQPSYTQAMATLQGLINKANDLSESG